MSYHRSLANNESEQSRDPRHRDRSRSDIRRPDITDTCSSPLTLNQPLTQEQPPATNGGVLEFFKTLGLNSQLIQALLNANPPKIEQAQPQQQSVNNAQDFASFLTKSYGLDATPQPVNRDPRRRHLPTITTPPVSTTLNHDPSTHMSSTFDRPTDPRSITRPNSIVTSHHSVPSLSITDSYKKYISSIDQSLVGDETRQRFQRIALLDNELDKLHRMNIELTKTSEKRSRRRTSTKDKDPLLKENEILQNELIDYIKTLKTAMMNNYPPYMFNNNTIIGRQ